MRWAPLLLLALLAAGCAKPAPAYAKNAVELEVNVLPLSGHLLFRTSSYNSLTSDIPDAKIRVDVDYAAPARNVPSAHLDANESALQLGARRIVNVDLETKFVDVGDYWWNVTIRDRAGALVANESGRYETCLC